MQNGNGHNGASMAPHTVQVNPAQAAAFALQFIDQVPHARAQREAFDVACMFLQAIVSGQLVLATPPAPAPALETPPPDPPPPVAQ